MKRRSTEIVAFSLRPRHIQLLDKWAKATQLSRSAVVRRMLEELEGFDLRWQGMKTVFK
ncbi:MAG: ribbon-helix-helix protein, CopG family [Candidatus Hodarchaeales archaeon]|jgi:hypothetical protein